MQPAGMAGRESEDPRAKKEDFFAKMVSILAEKSFPQICVVTKR
jgi:hypothetical protein